jgi:hypothetical protein
LISYFAKVAKGMGRNTVALARHCATLIVLTEVAAIHTGKWDVFAINEVLRLTVIVQNYMEMFNLMFF